MTLALRRAASQRIGGFSPTVVGFQNLYWSEGPEFQALGLADGAEVTTWPDEKSTADATQATSTKKPNYRATLGSNSKPCVQFDTDNILSATISSISQPYTFVAISAATDTVLTKGRVMTTTNALLDTEGGTKVYRYYAGTARTGGTPGQGWHLHTAYFVNSASAVYESDGTAVISGVSPGSGATGTALTIGNDSTEIRPMNGKIHLIGIYSGDARTDPYWQSLEDWVETYYGITIA